jgi:hypothetical protein
MDSTTIVLSFTPAVKCWHCGQPASYGVFDVGAQEMRIGCPTHGYAWDVADLGAEMASRETSTARASWPAWPRPISRVLLRGTFALI